MAVTLINMAHSFLYVLSYNDDSRTYECIYQRYVYIYQISKPKVLERGLALFWSTGSTARSASSWKCISFSPGSLGSESGSPRIGARMLSDICSIGPSPQVGLLPGDPKALGKGMVTNQQLLNEVGFVHLVTLDYLEHAEDLLGWEVDEGRGCALFCREAEQLEGKHLPLLFNSLSFEDWVKTNHLMQFDDTGPVKFAVECN